MYFLAECIPYCVNLSSLTLWQMYDLYFYGGYVPAGVDSTFDVTVMPVGDVVRRCLWITKKEPVRVNGKIGVVDVGTVKQDCFHFDTIFGNMIYENPNEWNFIRELNYAMNEKINNDFLTLSPQFCKCAGAA